jgi:benzoyl-CoA reductase/2-hydroxyglutaryl-CoA dehydratase subunit BcrC/BadD/HgdB
MTKKEINILDKLIQDLAENQDRIKIMRQTLGINMGFDFLREVETIEYIYECILRDRKNTGTTFFSSTSGWTVRYTRSKKKYTKGEKFWIGIHFTFVEADNYE